jgi:hypothetical protein
MLCVCVCVCVVFCELSNDSFLSFVVCVCGLVLSVCWDLKTDEKKNEVLSKNSHPKTNCLVVFVFFVFGYLRVSDLMVYLYDFLLFNKIKFCGCCRFSWVGRLRFIHC